jgi:hypothetical protein
MFLNYFSDLKIAQLGEFPILERLHQTNELGTPRARLAFFGCTQTVGFDTPFTPG